RDVETILQTHAELAVDHDRRLIAKAHARLNRRFVAAHEVSPFMTFKADAVAGPMRQARRFVIRTKACVGDYFSRGVINGFAWCTDPGGGKSCVLRFAFNLPNIFLTLRRFAEDEGARYV